MCACKKQRCCGCKEAKTEWERSKKTVHKPSEIYQKRVSRRNFMAGVGAAGAVAALAGCNSSSTPAAPIITPAAPNYGDTDYLNFALNLEYLEAEFYLRAATGNGLAAADIGSGAGAVSGGAKVPNLTAAQQRVLNEIAFDEQSHVQFLRKAITSAGATPVDRPAINLSTSFGTLATAAGITGVTFNPFGDFDSFLLGAFIFEDVGVTAYHGAAGLLSTGAVTGGVLTAAAGIMAVEAYHAAYVRTSITGRAIAAAGAMPATAYPYLGYANQISKLRGSLGGGNETQLTLPTSASMPSSVVAADANAVAYARMPDQVLHIVYGTGGGSNVGNGGFFPSGLNGKISVTNS